MTEYNSKNIASYEVFGAKMTIDVGANAPLGDTFACHACQCNCQQCFACRNSANSTGLDEISQLDAEKVLDGLLKAA
jgi:hypothetical protein